MDEKEKSHHIRRYPMGIRTGTYDHLDEPLFRPNGRGTVGQFSIMLPMPVLVRMVEALNYGTHRLLSAVVHMRLAEDAEDPLGLGLKKLLDSGVY